MKWFVRVVAGVIIALLFLLAGQGLVLYKIAFLGSLAAMYFVGVSEGIDMSAVWSDDDDDDDNQSGPLNPA